MSELGHLAFGNFNEDCDIPVDRDVWQPLFSHLLLEDMDENGYGIEYSDDTFEMRPYYWGDDEEESNKVNFWHKPSNYKMTWYKYPMRDAYANMEIDANQFVQVLKDCLNSYTNKEDSSLVVIHECHAWWNND